MRGAANLGWPAAKACHSERLAGAPLVRSTSGRITDEHRAARSREPALSEAQWNLAFCGFESVPHICLLLADVGFAIVSPSASEDCHPEHIEGTLPVPQIWF